VLVEGQCRTCIQPKRGNIKGELVFCPRVWGDVSKIPRQWQDKRTVRRYFDKAAGFKLAHFTYRGSKRQ